MDNKINKFDRWKWVDLIEGGDGFSLPQSLVLLLIPGGEGTGPNGRPLVGFPSVCIGWYKAETECGMADDEQRVGWGGLGDAHIDAHILIFIGLRYQGLLWI